MEQTRPLLFNSLKLTKKAASVTSVAHGTGCFHPNQEGVIITEMTVNDMTARLNTYSADRNDFRIVFELWIYDSIMTEYVFIQQGITDRCVWNQIWFNIM